ncbi:MATE efflux family protein [Bacteroidales bacterium KA00251]|nr:MATE efflux family protein [Bacteroidales bacterium KA00251]
MQDMLKSLRSSHARSILKLGLPIMIGQLGVILVGFIDNIMVGQYGTNELAAASFVNGVVGLAYVIAMGYTYGLTPLVAGSYARGDGKLGTLLMSGLASSTIVGLLLSMAMGIVLLNLRWLNQPEELLSYIRPYFLIQLIGILPVILFSTYKQLVDGVEKTTISMLSIIISNFINILFNYFLIFGKCGFPEMGLIGAGLSTLFSRFVCLFILFYEVHFTRSFKRIFQKIKEGETLVKSKVSRTTMHHITKIGMPSALQMGAESSAFSIAVVLVGWIGSVELASHQIVNTLSTLGFMMFYGLSSAVMIKVGAYYEMKKYDEIGKTVKAGMAIQSLIVVAVMLLVLLLRYELARIFTTDQRVIETVSVMVIPLAVYQFVDMLQILFSNALRGMRDVRFTARAAAFCYLILTLAVAYLLGFVCHFGVVGVWFGFPVGFATLSLLLIYRYKKLMATYKECLNLK